MSEQTRSEQACPACGQHSLALDEPPRIDVLGVQPWSDMVGMGDVQDAGAPGIVCLSCGVSWRDLGAFGRDERDAPAEAEDALDLELDLDAEEAEADS
jgi:hypothetical protein